MVTSVSEDLYPVDIEIQTLLPEPQYFFKWGDQVGSAPVLKYSFSHSKSFVMNDLYAEDFREYEMDPVVINNYLSNPQYELQSFSQTEKNVVHEAIQSWGNASGITFVEVAETSSIYGEIRFISQNYT